MQSALRLSAWVKPGGKIEISDSQLLPGRVDVIVLVPSVPEPSRASILDVLAEAPGHLIFENAEAVDAYLLEEREAWVS